MQLPLWPADSRRQELKESKVWCLTWGETAGVGSAVGVSCVSLSVAAFPSGSIKALIFGILCWNEAVQLQRTDHSPGKVLCWTFTCHSKMSVLAILWKMYPLCSYGLLQAASLFQRLKTSQLWEAAIRFWLRNTRFLPESAWSARVQALGQDHSLMRRRESPFCVRWWHLTIGEIQSFFRVPAQEKKRGRFTAQPLSAGEEPKGPTKRQDISVTDGNEPRCSEFPSAESVTRLSTQIRRIDVKKITLGFFLQGIEEQENLHPFTLDSDFWVKSPISKSLQCDFFFHQGM